MSLAQALSAYLKLNLLIAMAFLSLKIVRLICERYLGRPSPGTELRMHYVILTAIVAITMAHPFFPKLQIFEPAAKVWSAPSLENFSQHIESSDQGGYLVIPFGRSSTIFNAERVSIYLIGIAIGVLLLVVGHLRKNIKLLYRIKKSSFLLKRIGQVSIYATESISVPFSYWLPRHSDVVIPTSLMTGSSHFRVAVAHEIQHHRQSDTRWIYVMLGLRYVCLLNPFIHLWSRWLSEIQEFACDEALLSKNRVKSIEYAICLAEVAENAQNFKAVPASNVALSFRLVDRHLLKKRIEYMLSSVTWLRKSASWSIGGVVVGLIFMTAFASQGIVQDRRVTLADANQMAEIAKLGSDFPIEVNDLVLTQLNRFVGTPEGREFIKSSLLRMDEYREMINGKIREYQVPMELMAIPMIESGYKNQAERADPRYGAGLWMFIKPTALVYGLQVDKNVDERLNPLILTDAAMRYLKSNELRFRDWLLAIQAYNSGERRVQDGIEKTGSRNAWLISKMGYDNDKNYLAKVMAAILIMKNPKSVQ
jgi:beta-lactamase regulating signal transducer with metallopeptidase domain